MISKDYSIRGDQIITHKKCVNIAEKVVDVPDDLPDSTFTIDNDSFFVFIEIELIKERLERIFHIIHFIRFF